MMGGSGGDNGDSNGNDNDKSDADEQREAIREDVQDKTPGEMEEKWGPRPSKPN